jgi:hypothetical protein
MAELETSGIFAPGVIEDIQAKAASGLYAMRGFGTLRKRCSMKPASGSTQ